MDYIATDLLLIAQTVFLLAHGQTRTLHRQTISQTQLTAGTGN